MDEQQNEPSSENINEIESSSPVEDTSGPSPRDSQPYSIPVNNISQPESQPSEQTSSAAAMNTQNDFQVRQEDAIKLDNKKPKTKKKLFLFIVLVILLAAGGAAAYILLNQKTDSYTTKTTQTEKAVKNETKKASFLPTDVIDVVKSDLTKKFPNVVLPDAQLTGDQIAFRTSDTAPYWKIGDEKFYVNYTGDDAANLGVYFVGQSSKQSSAISDSLLSQGFVLASGNAYDDKASTIKAYTKQDVVCSANIGETAGLAQLNCGLLSKYSKSLDDYILVKQFADAYVAGGGTIVEGSIFSGIDIADSPTIGYKTAELGLGNAIGAPGGAIGLFYKKSGESWKFFIGTQAAIPCSEYKTVDLVNAFKGKQCYDSTKTGADATSYVH